MSYQEHELFVTPNTTTRDLRHASKELAKWSLEVAVKGMDNVNGLKFAPDNLPAAERIKIALNRSGFPKKTFENWRDAESLLAFLMLTSGILKDPKKADAKISEYLQPVDEFESRSEALRFLTNAFDRLNFLLSPQAGDMVDTKRITVYSYIESRVLNRMVNEDVYLTRPAA